MSDISEKQEPQATNGNGEEPQTGDKRAHGADEDLSPKRSKTTDDKDQTTIEDSMGIKKEIEVQKTNDIEPEEISETKLEDSSDNKAAPVDESKEGTAVENDQEREDAAPSTILEKGIIYFFFRGRVGVDEPEEVNDLARSYIILRPLPAGAKLGDGPIGDTDHCRLLALPKKVLPTSHRDKFMVFVEKAAISLKDLKNTFIAGNDYETQTAGSRHSPAATPVGEGVYAITKTGRDSHLAYLLTVPAELQEVQKDIGLRERASFVVSLKNPDQKGPANAQLDQQPEYPTDLQEKFRGLRWMPLEPQYLDYENSQILLIGESDGDIEKAVEPSQKDQKHDKDTPMDQMETLEHEDETRVAHLKGDDPIFADLGLSAKEYPKLQTTW